MARKKKQAKEKDKEKTTSDYYKLNTKAIEDLADANVENSPEVSEEELKQYRSGSKFKLPERFKLLFIKFWFAAAVCYFFVWGLNDYLADELDILFVTGIAMGMVTDILTNNALRFFATVKGGNDKYMMFAKRGYWTFPLNILYAWVLLALVYTVYNVVNIATNAFLGTTDMVLLGVEPIVFGLMYLGFDTLLIGAKHLAMKIVSDARKEVSQQ